MKKLSILHGNQLASFRYVIYGKLFNKHFSLVGIILCCTLLSFGQTLNDYRTRAVGNWSSTTTWQRYNGTSWVAAVAAPSSSSENITITHIVTVTANVTVDQVTVNATGKLIVNPSRTLTIANGTGVDLVVDGILENSGTVTSLASGTLNFNTNSHYTHARDAGTIPSASWDANSTCAITGVTGNVPSGLNQSFGNFEWNCTSQASHENLTSALATINGNFEIKSTNGYKLYLTNATSLVLNIGGDLKVSGGNLVFTNGNNPTVVVNVFANFYQTGGTVDFSNATQIGTLSLNVYGNFTQSAGTFDFASGNANVSRTPALRLWGNFSQTGTGYMVTSTPDSDITNGTITFSKIGTQTFSIAVQNNLSYINFIVAFLSTLDLNSDVTLSVDSNDPFAGTFTVNTGGTINMKTNRILSSSGSLGGLNNDFILNSGATFITANTNGIQSGTSGSISSSIANRTFSSGANFVFNGTSPQNSGTFTTSPTVNQVNNLTVNNTGGTTGVTLQQNIAIAGTCYFTAGRITTGSYVLTFNDNATASGANNNVSNPSYVNGKARKIGNDAFTFPVGKSNVGYMPCAISAPSSTTAAFTAEYMRSSATALGPCTASGLYRVSACEYWQLDRTSGSSNVNVTLWWSGLSPCNAAAYVTNLSSLVVAHFNGTSWDAFGANANAGNGATGYVTWNNVSNFSPFTLGSTDPIANPLPIRFSDVKAYKVTEGNKVEWKNLTEENVERYEVEHSSNGTAFSTLATVPPKSNTNSEQHYDLIDKQPLSGTNFYRIKAIENSGAFIYSTIVKVISETSKEARITVYPNPASNGQFTVQLSNYDRGNYQLNLMNTAGQKVMSKSLQHAGGAASVSFNTTTSLNAGIYMLQITGEGKRETIKLALK